MENMQGVNQANALMNPSGSITDLGNWVSGVSALPVQSSTLPFTEPTGRRDVTNLEPLTGADDRESVYLVGLDIIVQQRSKSSSTCLSVKFPRHSLLSTRPMFHTFIYTVSPGLYPP